MKTRCLNGGGCGAIYAAGDGSKLAFYSGLRILVLGRP